MMPMPGAETNILSRRRAISLAAYIAGLSALGACASASDEATAEDEALHDFDFTFGHWRVQHRSLRASGQWQESEGQCVTESILGGAGNVEDHLIHPAAGAYRALGVRSFDSQTRLWSIWWLDGRAPHAVGMPVVGAFAEGVGTFFGEDALDGRPIRTRFVWTRATHPQWEQAYSFDAGLTWETNWIMQFTPER